MDSLTSQHAYLHQRKPSEGVHSLQEVSRKLEALRQDLETTKKARGLLEEQNALLKQESQSDRAALADLQNSEFLFVR